MLDITKIREALEGFVDGIPLRLDLKPHPRGHGQIALVRDGYQIQALDGEKRRRRTHTFADVRSLAEWLLKHADPKETEILVGTSNVQAGLEPGTRDGDVVSGLLTMHPRLARWAGIFGREISQKHLHSFIIAAVDDVGIATDKNGEAHRFGPILAAQLQKLQVMREENYDLQLDELGNVKFAGSNESTTVSGSLPGAFSIRVPWYLGVEDENGYEQRYGLDILLRMDSRERPPEFTLSCPSLKVVEHEARLDAVAFLRRLLGEDWLVGIGTYSTEPCFERG